MNPKAPRLNLSAEERERSDWERVLIGCSPRERRRSDMLRSSRRKIYLVDKVIVVLIQGKTDLYKILIPCVTPWVNCFYLTVTLKVKVSKRAEDRNVSDNED